MPTILLLILALLVATCIIAYWSDNLGKKLGKKRISLMGLRPRQTATFISMGSSVGIMLLTLVVLLGSSASLRNALTRYDQTKKENSRLIRSNAELRVVSRSLEAATRGAEARVRTAQARTRQAEQQEKQAQLKASRARAALARAQADLTAARTSARVATRRAEEADNQYQSARASLGKAQGQLVAARSRLSNNQKTIQLAYGRLKIINHRLKTVNAKIFTTQQKLFDKQEDLASTQKRLRVTQNYTRFVKQESERQLEELNDELRSLSADAVGLKSDANFWRREIERLKDESAEITRNKEAIALGDVGIVDRSIFASQTVNANVEAKEARAIVAAVLDRGRAALSELNSDMVLYVPKSADGIDLTEEQSISLLVAGLSRSNVPVSLRLVAAGNHAPGENPIRVQFTTVEIRTIYDRGDVITRTVIENGSTDAQIFGKLMAMLKDGERITRSRGASPILTEAEPYYWPSGTNERIFEAIPSIQEIDGDAEVRLVAADNLTTTGPLRIRFEVSKFSD